MVGNPMDIDRSKAPQAGDVDAPGGGLELRWSNVITSALQIAMARHGVYSVYCEHYHLSGGSLMLVTVEAVEAVDKKDDLRVPEAFWKIRINSLPGVIKMNNHSQSLPAGVEHASRLKLAGLLA
jgi:hypothetical protein